MSTLKTAAVSNYEANK